MRYQTVTSLRKAGFRVKLDRNGNSGTARKDGLTYRLDRFPGQGWLFTSYGRAKGEVA